MYIYIYIYPYLYLDLYCIPLSLPHELLARCRLQMCGFLPKKFQGSPQQILQLCRRCQMTWHIWNHMRYRDPNAI